MVLRKPVIATDTGGTTELLMDGITGIITPQRNPQKLAENMQYLLNNKDIAEQMGRRGKERVLEHFSLYEMTKKFVDLYGKLLSESQNVPTNHAIPSG
jgi:glycosyltransferase involved in cell wall biosynthesis